MFSELRLYSVIIIFLYQLCFIGTHDESFEIEETSKQSKSDFISVNISWNEIDYQLNTVPTLQVVTNPLLSRQYSPIHEKVFSNLKELNAEYTRYAVWFPYPKFAVAELDPPSGILQCGNVAEGYYLELSCEQGGGLIDKIDFASFGTSTGQCGKLQYETCHALNSSEVVERVCIGQQKCSIPATKDLFGDPCPGIRKRLLIQIQCNPSQNNTYYNFTYMDPMLKDFLDATDGHSRIINFSTQPNWLFQLDTVHNYPDNASRTDWSYPAGRLLVDDTMKELGDYYGRLFSWYMNGGFVDEYGSNHVSNHYYTWDYTEIFNEVEAEHSMTVEYYTRAYDAVIQGIRRHTNNYKMKYVGMALGGHYEYDWYRYFLNHSNHAPDIPLDMISYHFYAFGNSRIDPLNWESFFDQLDTFTLEIEQIEQIRQLLSPETRTTINELGVILDDDNTPGASQFPLIYWNAAAALYAYAWAKISRHNIDIVGHSQLVGYPELTDLQLEPQYPSVALLNWTTGEGTAKYWTSKMLIETVSIGSDNAMITKINYSDSQSIFSQAFVTKENNRWVLLVNKRFSNVVVFLPGCIGGRVRVVDQSSGFGPPIESELYQNTIKLSPFAVAVVHMPR